MKRTSIEELCVFGQSVWFDNISRSMIESGKLREMIGLGLRGMTSNPTIFDKAISLSSDYDNAIVELSKQGRSTFEIYDELTVKDVQDAADMFREVYDKTGTLDGYVSLEINPKLAHNAKETIEEGLRLHKKVGRPNLMLKVPASDAGFEAIEALVSRGINVNATLIFSLRQYVNTAGAYIRGLEKLSERRKGINSIRSVASVFVSRIDTAVDEMLDERNAPSLKGRAAVANSRLIFQKYTELFSGEDFNQLKAKGANAQRVLWASTSTKNTAYSDIKYVSELIARNTVNTMPDNTFEAFLDHGKVREALTKNVQDVADVVKALSGLGIDINAVCEKLFQDGVLAFERSFESLLNSIEVKSRKVALGRS